MSEAKNTSSGPFDVGVVGDMAHLNTGAKLEVLPLPSLPAKPGWKTVEAHLGLLFTLIAGGAALFGFRSVTADRIQGGYDAIVALGESLGPMVAAAAVLHRLITSRGKFESNKVNATAVIAAAQAQSMPVPIIGAQALGGFKDPSTWIDLARGVGGSGIIPGKAGEVISSILFPGGGPAQRTRPRPVDERTQFDEAVLAQIIEALDRRLKEVEKGLNDPDSSRALLTGDVRAIMTALGLQRMPGDGPDATNWHIVPDKSALADPSRLLKFSYDE